MDPAILAILSISGGVLGASAYRFVKRRNQRLLREALRKKYKITINDDVIDQLN